MANRLFKASAYLLQPLQSITHSMIKQAENVSDVEEPITNSNLPTLPLEIWVLILKYVFESSYADYEYCNSYNFPIYKARHYWPNTRGDEERLTLLKTCRNTRLVCKLWAEITCPLRTITFKDQGYEEIRGMRKLVIKYGTRDLHAVLKIPDSTSSLREMTLYGHAHWAKEYIEAIDCLLDNSRNFPQLRSLSISSFRVPPNFWNRIG